MFTRKDRIFLFWLILAGLIGCAAGVPFSISVLNEPAAGGPINPQTVWLGALLEAMFLLVPASVIGLWLVRKMNLARISGRVHSFIIPSIVVGLALAIPGLMGRAFVPNWNLIVLIVIFNTIGGMVLGWLYVRYCLLAAMIAHFFADFVQHVIPRLI